MPEVGLHGQLRLKNAKVLIVGVGRPPLSTPARDVGDRVRTPLGVERERRKGHRKSLSTSSSSPALLAKKHDAERVAGGPLTPKRTTGSIVMKEGSLENLLHQQIKEKLEKEKAKEKAANHDKENVDTAPWKTTEEKKELLGTMLGNVDALVESVKKAGIFGLG